MVRVIARKKITTMKTNVLAAYSDTYGSLSYLGISHVLASKGQGIKGWHWPRPTSQSEWGSQLDFLATPMVVHSWTIQTTSCRASTIPDN